MCTQTLVEKARTNLELEGMPLGDLRERYGPGRITTGKSVFNGQYGSVQFSFRAGCLSADRQYALPDLKVFTPLGLEVIRHFDETEGRRWRIAEFSAPEGRTEVVALYLEYVVCVEDGVEAIIATPLDNRVLDLVAVLGLRPLGEPQYLSEEVLS